MEAGLEHASTSSFVQLFEYLFCIFFFLALGECGFEKKLVPLLTRTALCLICRPQLQHNTAFALSSRESFLRFKEDRTRSSRPPPIRLYTPGMDGRLFPLGLHFGGRELGRVMNGRAM